MSRLNPLADGRSIMVKAIPFLIFFLICLALPALSAGKRPVNVLNYYHFDGTAFSAGPAVDGSPFLAVREKMRPLVLIDQASASKQEALPTGNGAIVGICYLQSSGGKLGKGSSFLPCPRVPVVISSGGKQLITVQTDAQGYFVATLPAGTYSIGSANFTTGVSVENGNTTLVPLRAGKRMVD
jgi:hypothetical protein